MLESLVGVAVSIVGLYLAIGLVFAIAFAFNGVNRIDPAARKSTVGFRLLIIPGSTAIWPLMLGRWRRGTPPSEEHNSHRDLSHRKAEP
jgi:hypothetical protein